MVPGNDNSLRRVQRLKGREFVQQVFAENALAGRVALVTGAASGIGKEAAQLLANLGAFVWGTDRDANGLAETESSVGATRTQDVTDEAGWSALLADVRRESGRLDILVNNAGIMLNRPFLATTTDEWRNQQSINVDSVFFGMRTAIPLMVETAKRNGLTGSIINVSSVYGNVAGATFAAYSASKGAVRTLTKAVATEFATQGVRVNSLHPGPTATKLGKDWDPPVGPSGQPMTEAEILAMWAQLIPNGRPGLPSDMANAIAFLASDASVYMTGSELVVDGGYTMV
jgi:NAD(P)-dependent dehydrogenase (short-subunit alcohol dehydrogenase family)